MSNYRVQALDLTSHARIFVNVSVEETDNIEITLSLGDKTVQTSQYSYFSAYQDCRDQLLALGYGLLCKGSCPNAVQSRLAESSDQIYLAHLGEPARSVDLVSLWEPIDLVGFPDKGAQDAFAEAWLASLR